VERFTHDRHTAAMLPSDINAIPTRFYQPALSTAVNGHPSGLLANALGQVVTDVGDIAQCIYIILHTALGSDPHRPTFGSDLYKYLDAPIDTARPFIAREVRRAPGQWEPRLDLVQVKVTPSDVAALEVDIYWQISADYSDQIFVTNLALGQLA